MSYQVSSSLEENIQKAKVKLQQDTASQNELKKVLKENIEQIETMIQTNQQNLNELKRLLVLSTTQLEAMNSMLALNDQPVASTNSIPPLVNRLNPPHPSQTASVPIGFTRLPNYPCACGDRNKPGTHNAYGCGYQIFSTSAFKTYCACGDSTKGGYHGPVLCGTAQSIPRCACGNTMMDGAYRCTECSIRLMTPRS